MDKQKYRYTKDEYNMRLNLFIKQDWLAEKDDNLNELLSNCRNNEETSLIYSLLGHFLYIKPNELFNSINIIADYIINDSGFNKHNTQILSLTHDYETDSSQWILYPLINVLHRKGWENVSSVTNWQKVPKKFNADKNQLIAIDEFIGSGKTIRNRLKELNNIINEEFEIQLCFIAGIKQSIESLRVDQLKVFCPNILLKGISDRHDGDDLEESKQIMLNLEENLSKVINQKKLCDYSLGYGEAEALYSAEGCEGNTPNSVFPIFWWGKNSKNIDRKTLLTRRERGF
ncbi:MAG: hypothetical protein K9N06_12570 [Candidatus Cloacimonetes bacterium]|nr:hypothetical protein [Candidatus Cloacimonadota bacterium]